MEFKTSLTLKEEDFTEFRSHLLRSDGLERQAYCLTGIAEGERDLEILVQKTVYPSDQDYRVQHQTLVDTKPEFLLGLFSKFRQSELKGFLHAHSHPFTSRAVFSGGDDRYLPGEIRSLADYLSVKGNPKPFYFIRLVCGQTSEGFSGEVYLPSSGFSWRIEQIKTVGGNGINRFTRLSPPHFSSPDHERWDRHIRWFGEEGQKKISGTHLVICGAGGIGSVVTANAKGLGFKEITLIDPDRVEVSNLNRLIGAESGDVGELKVDVMAREIRKVDPGAVLHVLPCRVEEEAAHRAIRMGDVIVSGLDTLASRFELQILAARYLKVLLDIGSGITLRGDGKTAADMGGQIVLYYPGGPCLGCQGVPIFEAVSGASLEVRKAVGYIRGTDMTPPSVVTINSVMGGAGMNTLVKYLVGLPVASTHIRYDLLHDKVQQFNFQKKEGCPVCGEEGIEARGDEVAEILPCPQRPEANL